MKCPKIDGRALERVACGDELFYTLDLIPQAECASYAEAILSDNRLTGYGDSVENGHEARSAAAIRRGGLTCYEACRSPELREQYFGVGLVIEEHFRKLFSPEPSPIDVLMDGVQKAWAPGVLRERWRDKEMAGIVSRVFEDGSGGALPHNDVLWVDQAGEEVEEPLVSQLACNIYVATSPVGGELALWGFTPSRGLHKALQIPSSYGLDRQKLGSPLETILR